MASLVAVTGATGFIGTHLVRRLAADARPVRILTRRIPADRHFPLPKVEAVIGDLSDPKALDRLLTGAGNVIHLAGAVKAGSAEAFQQANVLGTRAIAEAAARQANCRFIHVSSLAAREPQLSDYALSKSDAELEIGKLSSGLRWIIIRPPAVYGPGDRETLGFFKSAARGFLPQPGPSNQRISFIDVNELCDFIKVISETTRGDGQTVEVDDGAAEGYSWPEIGAAMASATGKQLRTVRLPGFAVHAAAALNAASHRILGANTVFTPGKARELRHPDWVARPWGDDMFASWKPSCLLPEGFAKTMLWYRHAGWL
ncbi:MAG TPA: NAD-dependent epimerase/dehydratase family protein [Verrucomicrobiae bacterium]|nr:NAD-dependent epimerase/dehydratase family protein [Verrucomicrobiae bacterium]